MNPREFLTRVENTFLEKARERRFDISPTQIQEVKENKKHVYRRLYLPPELFKISRSYVHFEWLVSKNKGTKVPVHVALHLEYPQNRSHMNQRLWEFLRQRVDFEKLAQDAGGSLEISRRSWKWVTISREYEELNEDAVEWAADTMVFLYETLLPHIKEFLERGKLPVVVKRTPENPSKGTSLLDKLLKRKGQIILYGPPGTGKTWMTVKYVKSKVPGEGYQFGRDLFPRDDIKYPSDIPSGSGTKTFRAFDFVTFHPAFSYEDFVEGIKPETYEDPETGKKELLFKVEEGIFKRMARDAYNALLAWAGIQKEWTENSGVPSLDEEEKKLITTKLKTDSENVPKFYLIIDEINRGDIPKIFGELITLLETDKRLFMEHETTTTLPYSKKRFGVPPNLYIIGTMNTSDRSIALIDVALRRRFGFIEVMPDYDVIEKHIIDRANEDVKPLAEDALKALEVLNRRIRREFDRDHQIGHSYYLRLQKHLENKEEFMEELKMTWFHEILPLLQEYFYDSPEKLRRVLKSTNLAVSFLKTDDSEDIAEFRSEDEFDNETFLQALKSLIEAESE